MILCRAEFIAIWATCSLRAMGWTPLVRLGTCLTTFLVSLSRIFFLCWSSVAWSPPASQAHNLFFFSEYFFLWWHLLKSSCVSLLKVVIHREAHINTHICLCAWTCVLNDNSPAYCTSLFLHSTSQVELPATTSILPPPFFHFPHPLKWNCCVM